MLENNTMDAQPLTSGQEMVVEEPPSMSRGLSASTPLAGVPSSDDIIEPPKQVQPPQQVAMAAPDQLSGAQPQAAPQAQAQAQPQAQTPQFKSPPEAVAPAQPPPARKRMSIKQAIEHDLIPGTREYFEAIGMDAKSRGLTPTRELPPLVSKIHGMFSDVQELAREQQIATELGKDTYKSKIAGEWHFALAQERQRLASGNIGVDDEGNIVTLNHGSTTQAGTLATPTSALSVPDATISAPPPSVPHAPIPVKNAREAMKLSAMKKLNSINHGLRGESYTGEATDLAIQAGTMKPSTPMQYAKMKKQEEYADRIHEIRLGSPERYKGELHDLEIWGGIRRPDAAQASSSMKTLLTELDQLEPGTFDYEVTKERLQKLAHITTKEPHFYGGQLESEAQAQFGKPVGSLTPEEVRSVKRGVEAMNLRLAKVKADIQVDSAVERVQATKSNDMLNKVATLLPMMEGMEKVLPELFRKTDKNTLYGLSARGVKGLYFLAFGSNEEALAQWNNMQSQLGSVARLGGEVGNLSDKDIARMKSLFSDPTITGGIPDTLEVAKVKLGGVLSMMRALSEGARKGEVPDSVKRRIRTIDDQIDEHMNRLDPRKVNIREEEVGMYEELLKKGIPINSITTQILEKRKGR